VKPNLRRRFLIRCGQAAAALLLPRRLRSTPAAPFQLNPNYREQAPTDAMLQHIRPGHDVFGDEVHAEKMAAVLEACSRDLRESPINTRTIEASFSAEFQGTSWRPVSSQPLRTGSESFDSRRVRFAEEHLLGADPFLQDVHVSLSDFSKISTAEFQLTRVNGLTTQVRYEFVGTGTGFHREQRIGEWSIEWDAAYRIKRWGAREETRSRSTVECFRDITQHTFGGNSSYSKQMLHGADYWRTVIDGGSGIDIYGHNGVSVGDLHGDGLDDIYVCQPAGLPNRVYRNRGDGTFEDVTETSGLGLLDNTACALIADFDNNGRQDVVVVRASGPLFFLNQGKGKFKLKPDAFRFATPPQGTFTGAAAADYNRDGLLDIYLCLYSVYQGADQYNYPSPYFAAENGPPNFMMSNNGDGTFRDVTDECGMNRNNTRYSFCCGWNDFDGDGWPDLYVVNDFGRKDLYKNNGNGTFSDVARQAGVEDIGAGMSVCWFDCNNDGAEDLYVANMWTAAGERITHEKEFQTNAPEPLRALYQKHAMGNSLFKARGGSRFEMATERSGTGMGRWAWSSDAWDFDHDGLADLYVTNGMISGTNTEELNSFFWRKVVAASPKEAKPAEEYEQGWKAINEWIRDGYTWSGFERNVLYANHGDGTFTDVSGALGLDFVEDGRSFSLSDFDGDGRLEILVKNRNAPQIRLMKNVIPDLHPSIAFRLTGTKSNRDAIGAVITLKTSAGLQRKTLQAGSGFLSQHSKEVLFGLGDARDSFEAAIRWPSGAIQVLKDLKSNNRVWVTEGTDEIRTEAFKNREEPQTSTDQSAGESLPDAVETWLLAPIAAPSVPGNSRLITFRSEASFPEDVSAEFNLLFRSIFDRHRDMPLPTSFLLDEQNQIVKIYQGRVSDERVRQDLNRIPKTEAARLQKALPFPGVSETFEFGRNHLSLGSIFFQRGYLESAGKFFAMAPESAESLYGLGSVYLKQEQNTQAVNCFERAVKLKAGYPETTPNAWNNLGILATRAGDTAEAVEHFEKALAFNAEHVIALVNLGNAYRQLRRWDDARIAFDRALRIKPNDPEAHYGLAMVLAQNGNTDGAYEHLQKALEQKPAYPEALNNLGVLYLRTRRRDEAVNTFEKCMNVAPGFDQAYLNLARVYAIEGNREKARSVLQALLTQHPNHVAAQQALEQLR